MCDIVVVIVNWASTSQLVIQMIYMVGVQYLELLATVFLLMSVIDCN